MKNARRQQNMKKMVSFEIKPTQKKTKQTKNENKMSFHLEEVD